MSLQTDIQNLVLGFFETAGSNITHDDGVYRISIPEKYLGFFNTSELIIAFEESISSKHDCELVVPGSKILLSVIEICNEMGSVVLQAKQNYDKTTIRYHFFIRFSGICNFFAVDHVDVEMDTNTSESIRGNSNDVNLECIESSKITPTYTTALTELQKRYENEKEKFLQNANMGFSEDLEVFLSQHNLHVRELDMDINEKYRYSSKPDKAQEFRFETADKIDNMEKEKEHLIEVLQKKHQIVLSYQLVASEVILS